MQCFKIREITGKSLAMPWWLEGGEKDNRKKNIGPFMLGIDVSMCSLLYNMCVELRANTIYFIDVFALIGPLPHPPALVS
jgi:hypothetical protein